MLHIKNTSSLKEKVHLHILNTTLLWSAAFALIKGWGDIHEWANINWLINYDTGFIKRGLWGEVIGKVIPSQYLVASFEPIGTALLGIFLGVLLFISFHSLKKSNYHWITLVFYLAFFSSPFITMTANIRNYLDINVYIAGIASLFLLKQNRPVWSAILLSIGVLLHEISIVIFSPLVVAYLSFKLSQQGKNPLGINNWDLKPILTIAAPLFTLAIVIISQQNLDIGQTREHLEAHFLKYNEMGPQRAELYSRMLSYSFFDYIQEEAPKFLQRISDSYYLAHTAPMILLALSTIWISLRNHAYQKATFLIITVATFAPLSLHAIAFDTNRIWAMPILSSYLLYTLTCDHRKFSNSQAGIRIGLLSLATWVFYWNIEPFIMFSANANIFTSDIFKASIFPIIYVCLLISDSLNNQNDDAKTAA